MNTTETMTHLSMEQLSFVRGEISRLRPEVVNQGKVIDALPLPRPGEQAYGADYSVLTMGDKSFVLAYHDGGERLMKADSVDRSEREVPYKVKVAIDSICPNDGSSTEKIVSFDLSKESARCESCDRDDIKLSREPVTRNITQPQIMTGQMVALPLAAQGTSDEVLAKMVGDFAKTDITKLTQLLQSVGMKEVNEAQIKAFMGIAQGVINMPGFSVSRWLKEEARDGWKKVGGFLPENIRSQAELVLGILDQYQEEDHVKIYGPVAQSELDKVFVVRDNQFPNTSVAARKEIKPIEVGEATKEIMGGVLRIPAVEINIVNGKASFSYDSAQLKQAVELTTTRNLAGKDKRDVILWENDVELTSNKKKLFKCKVDAGQVGAGSIARLWFKYAEGVKEPFMTDVAQFMRKKGYEVEQGIMESKPTRDRAGKIIKDPSASVTWIIKGKNGFHYRMGQPGLLISSDLTGRVRGTSDKNELLGNKKQLNEFLQISCRIIESVCESIALQELSKE